MNTRSFFKTLAIGTVGAIVAPSILIPKQMDRYGWVNARGVWRDVRGIVIGSPTINDDTFVQFVNIGMQFPSKLDMAIPWLRLNPDGSPDAFYVFAKKVTIG